MKKLVLIALLFSSVAYADVVSMPDGKIVNCVPTSIGTIVCL